MFSHFQVNYFPYLGRVRGIKSVLKDLNFQSKQMGRRENKTINMEGRVQFDLLQVSTFSFCAGQQRPYAVHFVFGNVVRERLSFELVPFLLGSSQGLQVALIHIERCEFPLFARAEGGCAALNHH